MSQVYERVRRRFPDLEGWLDTYEIVGGDDLIETIAAGIENADKFLVFLSEESIEKPWVKAELREALMAEISGVKPRFIVPVKLGPVSRFPPFISSKRYIDMEALTEREWLDEIHAAVTEVPQNDRPEAEENLRVILDEDLGEPNTVAVRFQCRYWAEDISFRVLTLADIVERQYQLMPMNKAMLEYALYEENRVYAVQLPHDRLRKDRTEFAMLMKFASGVDLSHVIGRVERWDGSGGNGRRESGTKWYA